MNARQESENTTMSQVTLNVNGKTHTLGVRNDETLLETLRREFELTSVRGTCGIGICGTCSVLVDGDIVSSCLMLTPMADGKDILTSEGLVSDGGELSEVQEAFVEHGAYQCSFCIPAMVLTVHEYIAKNGAADIGMVKDYLGGNLCRCGTYPQILEAAASLLGVGESE